MVEIRFMENSDIAAVMELCYVAKWGLLDSDLRRLIEIQPDGFFVAHEHGTICGTASAVQYGNELGWIGMVVVHPLFRDHGIETQLMQKCISFLFGKQVECIKLDATDQNRSICLKLNFKDEQPAIRYSCNKPMTYSVQCDQITPSLDWNRIMEFDKIAFGAQRLTLLKTLAQTGYAVQFSEDNSSEFGYGFGRIGFNASYIGPVIATDCIIAQKIVNALLRRISQDAVLIDILPHNEKSTELVHALGFKIVKKVTRMYLGNYKTGANKYVFGAAGFELG